LTQVTKENQALEKKLNTTNSLINKLKFENQELKTKLIQNKINDRVMSATVQRSRSTQNSRSTIETDARSSWKPHPQTQKKKYSK